MGEKRLRRVKGRTRLIGRGRGPDDDIFASVEPTKEDVMKMLESAYDAGVSKGLRPSTMVFRFASTYSLRAAFGARGGTVDHAYVDGEEMVDE